MYFKIAFNRSYALPLAQALFVLVVGFLSTFTSMGERLPAGLSAIIYFLIMTCLIIYFNSISPLLLLLLFPHCPTCAYIMFKQLLLLMMLNID